MFEALLKVRSQAYIDGNPLFDRNNTAHSLLIHGSEFSGRMTHALEAARRRSCRQEGAPHCQCSSCTDFATYGMKNVVILSNRDHAMRIQSAVAHFRRLKTQWLLGCLIQSVRILLMSYHEALVGIQDTKGAALFAQAGEVDLLLEDMASLPPEDAAGALPDLEKALAPLLAIKKSAVNIDAFRGLHAWMHSTSVDDLPRFAIIEGMEESTGPANNSILKILEEPADTSYFIILSSRPMRLLPTILSRLQKHYIPALREEELKTILSTYFFSDAAQVSSLQDFYLSSAGYRLQDIHSSASSFADSLSEGTPLSSAALDEMFSPIDSMRMLSYYLEQVMKMLKERQETGRLSLVRYTSMLTRIRESYQKARTYNQQVRTCLEGLYYSLLGVQV